MTQIKTGKRVLLSYPLLLILLLLFGNKTSAEDINRPKAIITINIENMRHDFFHRFQGKLRPDGFVRLYEEGFICSNNKIELSINNTLTSAATVHTGTWPSSHGIIDKTWYDNIEQKIVPAINDSHYITIGGNSDEGQASALNLKTLTLGDHMKLISNKKSKVFSIAPNKGSAILSAGHIADGAFWIENETGQFISSSYYLDKFPQWVLKLNQEGIANKHLEEEWTTSFPIEEYTESIEDEYIMEKGYFNRFNVFPYNTDRLYKRMGNFKLLKATPFSNKMIGLFTQNLIVEESIGKDDITDIVNITFSILDEQVNQFTPLSVEVEDIFIKLDEQIATILNTLDSEIGQGNYVVSLIGHTPPSHSVEYLKEEMKLDVEYFYPEQAIALLKSYLNITFTQGNWIVYNTGQHIFLDWELIRNKGIDLKEMQKACSDFILQFRGVESTFSGIEMRSLSLSDGRNRRFKHGFYQKRSGDVLFSLEPNWQIGLKYDDYFYTTENKSVTIFMGKNIKSGEYTAPTQVVDIVPTLLFISNIPVPSGSDGKAIVEAKR